MNKATSTLGCGNEKCICDKQCQCPYGACSCEVLDTAETLNEPTEREKELEQEYAMGEIDLETKEVVININIGVLGHVNSGKTSLVRALSKTLSTACLDKNPQSKERGMTLDLGFSSFATQAPPVLFKHLCDKIQFTLVDCPGHASLIKTIINGAQIIDRMLLVVDVTKGIQMQTAECLVLGEILTNDLLIVLNKIDLLMPLETRSEQIAQAEVSLRKALSNTPFAQAPMIPIAAFVDGGDSLPAVGTVQTHNLLDLVKAIRDTTVPPIRNQVDNFPLLFAVDHCFPIKGMGECGRRFHIVTKKCSELTFFSPQALS
jgi:selenocysteine-specific elongation factor